MKSLDQYIKDIEKELSSTQTREVKTEEVGTVTEVKDGIVTLEGLDNVGYGELLEFSNGVKAMVIDLIEDSVGGIVLGDYLTIRAGDTAKATGRTLSLPVSEGIIGRVVSPLADALDEGEKIKADTYYPLEKIAPGVVERKSVSVPLQTGIKSIDALIPIGRGQRELIIGDKGTGKTTIATDTILNQKGQNMICVYCAIGQKNSKVATTVELLRSHGAMDYTVVVSASAADPAARRTAARRCHALRRAAARACACRRSEECPRSPR